MLDVISIEEFLDWHIFQWEVLAVLHLAHRALTVLLCSHWLILLPLAHCFLLVLAECYVAGRNA